MSGFTNLIVWKEAAALAAAVNQAAETMRGPRWAKDQLLRAVESIAANIAEGYGRGLTRDCIRFFSIARASANETENHLNMASVCRRLPEDAAERLIGHTRRVNYLINRYVAWLEKRLS